MSRRPAAPGISALYRWLAEREELAAAAPSGATRWTPEAPSYDGKPERLEAFKNAEPVTLPVSGLPSWARGEEPIRWYHYITVFPDGRIEEAADGEDRWLAEYGL